MNSLQRIMEPNCTIFAPCANKQTEFREDNDPPRQLHMSVRLPSTCQMFYDFMDNDSRRY
jgi:hypothetical protein